MDGKEIEMAKDQDYKSLTEYEFGGEPIETAPTDGTLVRVFAPADHELPPIECDCAYYPDGGWCVDELREVTRWKHKSDEPNKLVGG